MPLSSSSNFTPPTTPRVLFESRGVVLLHGPAEAVRAVAEQLSNSPLRLAALVQGQPAQAWPRGLRPMPGRLARVEGWLGEFRAFGAAQAEAVDLAPLSPHPEGTFDLLLDLADPPCPMPEVLPLGYYAPRDQVALQKVLAELPKRVGKFAKPQYFNFHPHACVHRRQEVEGCRACLDVCPAGAIRSGKTTVEIEAHLCQGCGTCALVCPTGAAAYQYPSPDNVLERTQQAVAERGALPLCLCPPGQAESLAAIAPEWLILEVHSPAAYGLDLWLSLLNLGIPRLRLLPGAGLTDLARGALDRQIAQAQALLGGLGWPADCLAAVYGEAEWRGAVGSLTAPGTLPPGGSPRARVFAALEDLCRLAEPPPQYALPTGAAYGEVLLDPERCTLCFACVRLCPESALQESEGALWFTESRCLQCGLCVNGCPTHALRLSPRILYAPLQRQRARCLHRDEAFQCVECGRGFANRALVAHSLSLMADFPHYQGEGRRLLEMCPKCRQRASLGLGKRF